MWLNLSHPLAVGGMNCSISQFLQKKVKAEELVVEAHRDSDVHEGDFFSLFFYDDCERSSNQYTVKLKQKVGAICMVQFECLKQNKFYFIISGNTRRSFITFAAYVVNKAC